MVPEDPCMIPGLQGGPPVEKEEAAEEMDLSEIDPGEEDGGPQPGAPCLSCSWAGPPRMCLVFACLQQGDCEVKASNCGGSVVGRASGALDKGETVCCKGSHTCKVIFHYLGSGGGATSCCPELCQLDSIQIRLCKGWASVDYQHGSNRTGAAVATESQPLYSRQGDAAVQDKARGSHQCSQPS